MVETRRLAAILAADVVGFSRMTGADEDRTLARLRALRSDLIDPTLAVHNGRVFKRTGDGALVEFRSVVDAVRCAIEVQNAMVERNAGVPPERRIEFRIGIHLGDVVEESDGDLMGDGINIAARLEGVAKPGAICLSEQAYWQVKGRLDLAVTDLGEQSLKNIAEPVRAYSLQVGAPAQAKPEKPPAPPKRSSVPLLLAAGIAALLVVAAASAWYFLIQARTAPNAAPVATATIAVDSAKPTEPEPSKPARPRLSFVVLPFANLSGDAKQDYLADVLTDALTTYISRIPGSFVIARNTAFTYKGRPVDMKQVGAELGVRYALEGSMQPTATRIRVNAQLIDTESGAHLWAEEFDTDNADLLQTQDEIVTRLARVLQIQVTDIEAARLERAHPANPDAQELALRCRAALWNSGLFGKQAEAGSHLCEQALEIDPNNVAALTSLSERFSARVITQQSTDRQADIARADELASRALALDPNDPDAHASKSNVLIAQGRAEEARTEAERAIALNPSQMNAYIQLCIVGLYTGQPESVIACDDKAMQLSPRDPVRAIWMGQKGNAYFMLRQDDRALEWFQRALAVNPNNQLLSAFLAATLALTGHDAEGRATLARYLAAPGNQAKTIAALKKQSNSDNPVYLAFRERWYDGLRKAGMPEG